MISNPVRTVPDQVLMVGSHADEVEGGETV
eukprot:COSAG02_NODE_48052_length_336_cov_1.312236_1_plen_29_part_10